jgi:aspartyl-tRNA synthetase
MSYAKAMTLYGSDKPDLRIPGQLERLDSVAPSSLVAMLCKLENPIVEGFCINMQDDDPDQTRAFISSFMNPQIYASKAYAKTAHGMPGISIIDSRKPLGGLASLGHEGAEAVRRKFELTEGDVLVMCCRPNEYYKSGSTPIGDMRRDMYYQAAEQGLASKLSGFRPAWIVDFPLFTEAGEEDAAQAGASGLCATHHPFTAPKCTEREQLSKLLTDPLTILGDHFDLVINGVEVGGGSRRIHDGVKQEFILRDVLKLGSEKVESFRHLIEALKDGCPPHTGFAIGFDRLLALLLDVQSVRDVIAFPKDGSGSDPTVKSPSAITEDQLNTYHLTMTD